MATLYTDIDNLGTEDEFGAIYSLRHIQNLIDCSLNMNFMIL